MPGPAASYTVPGSLQRDDAFATWFGGNADPDDDGSTASGLYTRSHPWILGCALPCRVSKATPKPKYLGLPWGTTVVVETLDYAYLVALPLIDNGPSDDDPAKADIDLTIGAFAALGVPVSGWKPQDGGIKCRFTVYPGRLYPGWSYMFNHFRKEGE